MHVGQRLERALHYVYASTSGGAGKLGFLFYAVWQGCFMVTPEVMTPTATLGGMPYDRNVEVADDVHHFDERDNRPLGRGNRVLWGPVIAGALLVISLEVLSSSLAYACGLPAFAGGRYGWGAGFWSVLTAALAFFAGGAAAAYLLPTRDARFSLMHGLLVWALTVPLILFAFAGLSSISTHGLMAYNVSHMTVRPQRTGLDGRGYRGAAWGEVISLGVGLVAAAIGGALCSQRYTVIGRARRTTTATHTH